VDDTVLSGGSAFFAKVCISTSDQISAAHLFTSVPMNMQPKNAQHFPGNGITGFVLWVGGKRRVHIRSDARSQRCKGRCPEPAFGAGSGRALGLFLPHGLGGCFELLVELGDMLCLGED